MAFHTPTHKGTLHFGSPEIPDSPSFDISSDDLFQTSERSLEFLNAQLIAHGFTSKPGLCLDGTDAKDAERVVRCILGLLGQRMQDVNRTEALGSNLRTLTYEHERLKGMHKSAVERADNAEREANIARTKLAATKKTLDETIAAHKGTMAELTRTRTLMQGIRATHAAELRKRDKALSNFPPNTTTSSITFTSARCLNSDLRIPQEKAILEAALEDAEKARKKAISEIRALREVVRDAINGVNRHAAADKTDKPYYTIAQLFPISPPPPTYAADKLEDALSTLKGVRSSLAESQEAKTPPPTRTSKEAELEKEITSMAAQLEDLRSHLAETNKRAAADAQAMLERFNAAAAKSSPEIPTDQMRQLRETEAKLDNMHRELEAEQIEFAEARTKLSEDQAELEAERKALAEEKLNWETERIRSDLLPAPPSVASPKPARKLERLKKSKSRSSHGRRSSVIFAPTTPGRGQVAELAYETEVVANMEEYLAPPDSVARDKLLPDAFVLPPPTPRTSWPPADGISSFLSPIQPSNTTSSSNVGSSSTDSLDGKVKSQPSTSARPASSSAKPPKTPSHFPVAKPFARNMIHAYSPAKPSPLSRILKLGGSPNSSGSSIDKLEAVEEADWEEEREKQEIGRGLSEEDLFPPVEKPAPVPKSIQPIRKVGRKVAASSPTKPKMMPIRSRTAAVTVVPSKPTHLSPKKSRTKDSTTAKVVSRPVFDVGSEKEKVKKAATNSQKVSSGLKVTNPKTTVTKPVRKGWS